VNSPDFPEKSCVKDKKEVKSGHTFNDLDTGTPMIRALLIDHDDSFTYNIKAWLEGEDLCDVEVCHWKSQGLQKKEIAESFDLLVFSPGPGHPLDYGNSMDLMKKFTTKIPIFGVCLGMQFMLELLGIEVCMCCPSHGKQTRVQTNQQGLFKGIESLLVGRYHSLGVKDVQGKIQMTAWAKDGTVMGIQDAQKKLMGVQFHPESFLTEHAEPMRNHLMDWIKS